MAEFFWLIATAGFVAYLMHGEGETEEARKNEETIDRAAQGLRKFLDKAEKKSASDEEAPQER
jgi:hypothetical protein